MARDNGTSGGNSNGLNTGQDAAFDGYIALSAAVWVMRRGGGSGNYDRIISKGFDNSGNNTWGILLTPNTGNIAYATVRLSASQLAAEDVAALPLDTWTHLCMTYSSAAANGTANARLRFYVNGSLVDSDTLASGGSINTNSYNLRIGGDPISPSNTGFPGRYCECGVWNAELDASAVAQIAAGKRYDRVYITNLVSYWRMNSNSSPEPDSIGGYNATVNSATYSSDRPSGIDKDASVIADTDHAGGLLTLGL